MERILAGTTVGMSELKTNPARTIERAIKPIAVLNRNRVAGYIVSPAVWRKMMDRLDDAELLALVQERREEASVAVDINDLQAPLQPASAERMGKA
ncbi:MAG: type II toxin-antitoxin system Phd/YefM family antitoxin [Janthinobacterium lividum]